MTLTALSLFSGIGGLDLGFEAAGFQIVGSVESDPLARDSLSANRAWAHLEPHDVKAVSSIASQVGVVDVIVGAPPCQPFSTAGQWTPTGRAGLLDDRGLVIYSVLDLVAKLKPKILVLENVLGFVQGRTSVLPVLQKAMPGLSRKSGFSYEVSCEILDANSFGVPQQRKRAIVTLSRVGSLNSPTPLADELRPVSWDALKSVSPEDDLQMTGKWAGLLPSIPEGKNYQWHTTREGGLPLFGYRTRYWSFLQKLAKDKPAWTLAASPGPATGPFHWDNRPLAKSELLALQGFPSGWIVKGDRRATTRQIGNATPPPLAEAVARQAAVLLGQQPAQSTVYGLERRGPIPPSDAVTAVPDRYRCLASVQHPDHPGTGKGPAPLSQLLP